METFRDAKKGMYPSGMFMLFIITIFTLFKIIKTGVLDNYSLGGSNYNVAFGALHYFIIFGLSITIALTTPVGKGLELYNLRGVGLGFLGLAVVAGMWWQKNKPDI